VSKCGETFSPKEAFVGNVGGILVKKQRICKVIFLLVI
jgi:hypothetical protein